MTEKTKEKVKRNRELYQDYKTGMETLEIQNKYKLSQTRVYAIVSKFKNKETKK